VPVVVVVVVVVGTSVVPRLKTDEVEFPISGCPRAETLRVAMVKEVVVAAAVASKPKGSAAGICSARKAMERPVGGREVEGEVGGVARGARGASRGGTRRLSSGCRG